VLVHPENLNQLLENHINSYQVDVFRNNPTLSLAYHLIEARVIMFLSVLGIIYAIISRRWLALYAGAWMATAFTLLYRHVPVWSHQQLLVTIPAVTLAAGATGEAFSRIKELLFDKGRLDRWDFVRLVGLAAFVFTILTRTQPTLTAFNYTPAFRTPPFRENSAENLTLGLIMQYSRETNWFITDLPIYAFYSGLPIPPNLAVFSAKRVETGNLSEEEVLATINKLQPEQVLLGRNRFPAVQRYLEEHYQVSYEHEPLHLYLKKGITSPDEGIQ
jgi:hypothetical protein